MVEGNLITEELRSWIGREFPPQESEVVTKRDIGRYADAIGHRNPLYWNEAYAKNTPYGSVIAPRLFFGIMGGDPSEDMLRSDGSLGTEDAIPYPKSLPRRMAGGRDFEFFLPVCPGDVITARRRIADIYQRQGSTGPLIFTLSETTFVNQDGQVVAKETTTGIAR